MEKSFKKIIIASFFSSFVIIFTYIKISIPIGNTSSMIHLGNVMCLLSGLMLGPFYGGLAAGIGSFIFDLLNPEYFLSAPISLLFKFIMVFVCGIVFKTKISKFKVLISTSFGAVIYVLLHGIKIFITNKYIFNFNLELNLFLLYKNLVVSSFNAILAVSVSVLIYKSMSKKIKNFDIFN